MVLCPFPQPTTPSQTRPGNRSRSASSETIGHVGCAVTSVAMLVSGHGYVERPKPQRQAQIPRRLCGCGHYLGRGHRHLSAGVYRNLVLCRDTAAPLSQIDAPWPRVSLSWSRSTARLKAGLQTHWVVLYKKQGNDYLMLDPWPHPTESGQDVLLTPL